ncbi:MAG: flagellar filament capping protein FliD, partial [Planctomycetia bacterium]
KSVMGDIRQALFGVSQTTVANDTEGYSMLSLVGIKSKTNGMLEIDNTKLDSKLASNIDAFADLFADLDGFSNGGAVQNTPAYYTDITADSGLAASLDRAIDKMMKTYTGQGGNVLKGIFDTRSETYNTSISKLSKDITAKEAQVAKFQETLIARFTKLEEVMGGLNSQGASLQAALAGLM